MTNIDDPLLAHLDAGNPEACSIEFIHTDATYIAASRYIIEHLKTIAETAAVSEERIAEIRRLLRRLRLERSILADSLAESRTQTSTLRETLRKILANLDPKNNPNPETLIVNAPNLAADLAQELAGAA